MEMATDLFNELTEVSPEEYENRIIFLTDAMPNIGDISGGGLLGMTEDNAGNRIYTTFIGIGLDFNTELVEYITKIRGANYYSVHSAEQFRERMDDEFEYMVTPLVFDLQLTLESDDWKIEEVYGSPEADQTTGELMKVNTLFPAKKRNDETRGGIVLLKLEKTGDSNQLSLIANYEDRNGNKHQNEITVELDEVDTDFFENRGIRKGILLSRYADLLKNWMIDEREHAHYSYPWEPRIDEESGICVPPRLNQWERQSLPLTVAEPYRKLFGLFYRYFDEEIDNIGDNDLRQELDILDILKS
jgi:Ca-activated chloride channel family protein